MLMPRAHTPTPATEHRGPNMAPSSFGTKVPVAEGDNLERRLFVMCMYEHRHLVRALVGGRLLRLRLRIVR